MDIVMEIRERPRILTPAPTKWRFRTSLLGRQILQKFKGYVECPDYDKWVDANMRDRDKFIEKYKLLGRI